MQNTLFWQYLNSSKTLSLLNAKARGGKPRGIPQVNKFSNLRCSYLIESNNPPSSEQLLYHFFIKMRPSLATPPVGFVVVAPLL